jgi:hypothetical protein
MTTIAELIVLNNVPEEKRRRKEMVRQVTSTVECAEGASASRKYECEVLNFLFRSKHALGIQAIFQFANLRVDGAIVLVDGRRLVIEIKLRMNWKKALEAGYEFRRFLLSHEAKANPVTGAIVFFDQFEGSGWHEQPNCRFLEDGWNEWYRSHSKFDTYRLDLLRLPEGGIELEDFQSALAKGRASKSAARILTAYEKRSHKDKLR